MAGVCGQRRSAGSVTSRYSAHSVGSFTSSFRAQSRNPGTLGSERSTGLSGCCDYAQHDRGGAQHDRGARAA